MRRLAAILMLVVFASLNAVDGICCPDGCTREETASIAPSGPSTDGICLLCTGGLHRPVLQELSPNVVVGAHVKRITAVDPNEVPSDPPEHPPRS